MTTSKPEVDINGLYSQKQTAGALGVDRHTVARYAANGVITFWPRACGGKVTTGAEIVKCWQRLNDERNSKL
jgi:hypothetical protein